MPIPSYRSGGADEGRLAQIAAERHPEAEAPQRPEPPSGRHSLPPAHLGGRGSVVVRGPAG